RAIAADFEGRAGFVAGRLTSLSGATETTEQTPRSYQDCRAGSSLRIWLMFVYRDCIQNVPGRRIDVEYDRRVLTQFLPGSVHPTWPTHDTPRFGSSVLAIVDHQHAVDEDVVHSGRDLVRAIVRGVIDDGMRIERHYVGKHTFAQETTVADR